MPVWQAVVYGVVQGLAEFLPISSSAHLTLLPWALGWEDPGLAFDVALHWGTLAAVLAIFWKDWIRLLTAGLTGRGSESDRRLFWGLVISAIPAAIIGKLLDKWAESNLRAPLLIACTMAVLGLILWYADRVGRKSRDLREMTIPRAFSIGVAQAAALVPGVWRSRATISLGLLEDFTREEIARFSFLMSTLFFFNDTATTEIYTLSLHDALPICARRARARCPRGGSRSRNPARPARRSRDRKSTRLNSSHGYTPYAVFCLQKIDVALHWGTLAAVLAIFWKDWIRLLTAGLTGRRS